MRFLLSIIAAALSFSGLAAEGSFRIVAFGDFNGPYGTVGYSDAVTGAIGRIISLEPDLVLFTGDLVAGQDHELPAARFAEMWQAFDVEIAGPLRTAGIAYVAAMGNHDASSLLVRGEQAYARERDAASGYWATQLGQMGVTPHDLDDYPFNWSFSLGPVHVTVWDASSSHLAPGQVDWLLEQLAGSEARAAGHRLLLGHLPLFGISEGRDRAGEVLPDGAALAARLAAAGLDTYVSGHQAAWYPGRHAGLELLMNGGIGGRQLVGARGEARSTFSVMDITEGGVSYLAFDAVTFELLDPQRLPSWLDAHGGRVLLSCRLNENPDCRQ